MQGDTISFMPWYVLAGIAAVLAATVAVIEKKLLVRQHAMQFSASLAILTLVTASPFVFTADFSSLTFTPVLAMFLLSMLGATAFLLVSKAMRHMEISSASPLLALQPGITALFAWITIGETLSIGDVTGICLLVLGAYVLETRHHGSVWEPIRMLVESKYIHYILFAIVLYGLTALGDRIVLFHYSISVPTYMVVVHVFLAFHFLWMMTVFHGGVKEIRVTLKDVGWVLFVVAILTVGHRFVFAHAVAQERVGLAEAIKRSSAFFVTLIGGELFHEKNLKRKLVACLIILAGVALIVV